MKFWDLFNILIIYVHTVFLLVFGYISNETGVTGETYTVSNLNGTMGSYILIQFLGGNGKDKDNKTL